MSDSRVPKSIFPFNSYLTTTDNFLQAISSGTTHNWERLGLSTDLADAWHNQLTAWQPLFDLWSSDSTRTKTVVADVHSFIDDFIASSRNTLNLIASSPNAISSDGVVFHLVITADRAKPSHPTMPITATCEVGFERLGGSTMRLSFHETGNSGRPAIVDGADSVQTAVQIGGAEPPNNPDEMTQGLSTHAVVVHGFGPENIGQRLYIFVRFYNTKYPEFAGPWSILYTVMIS